MSTETLVATFVGAMVTIFVSIITPVLVSLRNQIQELKVEIEHCHRSREKEKVRRIRLEAEVHELMRKLGMPAPDWIDDDSEQEVKEK